jgi:pyruvate dehydrogenase E2 component (dihydrolipoamide acetyltransferase)
MTDEGAGKTDLSGATVYDVERKSLLEITNVGSLGLDTAYVPLVPYSRVPILLALGSVRDSPVVRDGKVVVGKTMKVNATFDHRFIDGFHASVLSRVVRDWFEHPYQRFDNLDQMPTAASKSAAAAAG